MTTSVRSRHHHLQPQAERLSHGHHLQGYFSIKLDISQAVTAQRDTQLTVSRFAFCFTRLPRARATSLPLQDASFDIGAGTLTDDMRYGL